MDPNWLVLLNHRDTEPALTWNETTKLTNMPKTKSWFPLVHSASRDCLFTVGGYSNGGNMNETTQYLITGEKW